MPEMDHNHNHNGYSYRRYVTPILVARACRTVTDNQPTIDALQALVDNCDKLAAQGRLSCNASFKNSVAAELARQRAIGVVIGQDCSSTPTSYTIYNRR